MNIILNWLAVLGTLTTSVGVLLHQNWRWGIGFQAAQYICVFWLVQPHWPVSMATVKLVTGWMACIILATAKMSAGGMEEMGGAWPQGRLFRIFSSGIMFAASFALALPASAWLGLGFPLVWGSLILIGIGLLQLGITSQPFRVILGLLTILAGFEILYAEVESSTLVAALLSSVNLGLAVTGAYFINLSLEKKS